MFTIKKNKILKGGKEFQFRGASVADIFLTQKKTQISTNQTLNELANMGANCVRIPIIPQVFSKDMTEYCQRLSEFVLNTLNLGMTPILDCHLIGAWGEIKKELEMFWIEFLDIFDKDILKQCVFELFNEPTFRTKKEEDDDWHEPTSDDWLDLKPVLESVLTLIRTTGCNNLVLIGSPNWSGNMVGIENNPITDDKVAYVLHCYNSKMKEWNKHLRVYQGVAKKYPIVITEMGFENNSEREGGNVEYARKVRKELINPFKMGYIFWSYSSMNGVNSGKCDNWEPNCVIYGKDGNPKLLSAGEELKLFIQKDNTLS